MVTRIYTDGYRGPGTNEAYMPPGEYTVGDHLDIGARIIPVELATYLVENDMVTVTGEANTTPVIGPSIEPPFDEPDETLEETKSLPDWSGLSPIEESDWDLDLLDQMTVEELRDLAEAEGIELTPGYVKKAELIHLITGEVVFPDDE